MFNEAFDYKVKNFDGNVVGWTFLEQDSRKYLQTLFVLLHKPSKPVKIDGLPVNVVPMTRTTTSIAVTFPDGSIRKVSRTQVQVMLNFSMTDYNSQGRA